MAVLRTIGLTVALLLGGCAIQLPESPTPQADSVASTAPAVQVSRGTRAQFSRALAAMQSGDWTTAETLLVALTEERPDLAGPALNLALTCDAQGKSEAADEWFRRARDLNPANLDAHNAHGIFLRRQGRFSEAEQAYLDALARYPEDARSHRNIGVLYDLYLGDTHRALRHFNRYLELSVSGDRTVAAWVADLQRQAHSVAQGAAP